MIKSLIFVDFDGTICHDRFWRSLDSDLFEKLQKFLFQENRELVNEWMRGKHTSEEINQLVSENINIPFDTLWEVFEKDCRTMSVSEEILKRIHSLRESFHTILITGNMDCFTRFTVPELKLNDYFDVISNSYDDGILKSENNGELFTKYANSFNSSVSDSFLIDDSQKVCDTFEGLGGIAYLVTPNEDIYFHLTKLEKQV